MYYPEIQEVFGRGAPACGTTGPGAFSASSPTRRSRSPIEALEDPASTAPSCSSRCTAPRASDPRRVRAGARRGTTRRSSARGGALEHDRREHRARPGVLRGARAVGALGGYVNYSVDLPAGEARRVRRAALRAPARRSSASTTRTTSSGSTTTSSRRLRRVDAIAERYLRLGLGLGKHVDGLVDGYYGPPSLAEEERQSLAELLEETRTFRAHVATADLDEQRRRWLTAQLDGLECVAEMTSGVEVPWRDAVRRCYGVEVERIPEERFEEAHARLDAALPGSGELADRLEAWRVTQDVPTDKLLPGFHALVDELRRARTSSSSCRTASASTRSSSRASRGVRTTGTSGTSRAGSTSTPTCGSARTSWRSSRRTRATRPPHRGGLQGGPARARRGPGRARSSSSTRPSASSPKGSRRSRSSRRSATTGQARSAEILPRSTSRSTTRSRAWSPT